MLNRNTAGFVDASMVVIATGAGFESGTVYCFVQRASDSYWLKANTAWQSGKPTTTDIPTMTHVSGGLWNLAHTPADANDIYKINCIDSSATCFPDNYNIVVSYAPGDNIDFGALQKASLNAATPAGVQNIPATGTGFTALGDTRLGFLDASILARPTLSEIEGSTIIAKESTLVTIAGYLDTEVAAILAIAQRLDTALELDGVVYRFTVNALENAPSGGGGTAGSNACVVTVYVTATITPIADVFITIMNATKTLTLGVVTTDTNGQTKDNYGADRVMLDPISSGYKLILRKAGVVFSETTLSQADVIAGSKTIYGTALTLPAPGSADACTIGLYLFKQNSVTPIATADVNAKATIVNLPYEYNGKYHTGQTIDGTYNGTTGLLTFEIVWGARVDFDIKHMSNETLHKTIPLLSTVLFEDLQ